MATEYLGGSSKCEHCYHRLRWQGASSGPQRTLAPVLDGKSVLYAHRLQDTAQEVDQQLRVSQRTPTYLGLSYDPALASNAQQK